MDERRRRLVVVNFVNIVNRSYTMYRHTLGALRVAARPANVTCRRTLIAARHIPTPLQRHDTFARRNIAFKEKVEPVELAFDVTEPTSASNSDQSLVICHGLL